MRKMTLDLIYFWISQVVSNLKRSLRINLIFVQKHIKVDIQTLYLAEQRLYSSRDIDKTNPVQSTKSPFSPHPRLPSAFFPFSFFFFFACWESYPFRGMFLVSHTQVQVVYITYDTYQKLKGRKDSSACGGHSSHKYLRMNLTETTSLWHNEVDLQGDVLLKFAPL